MHRSRRFLVQPSRQSEGREDGGSFTDPVFDDEYYGKDQAGGKGRTIGLVVGVVVGAVIAGAAAWLVFGPNSGDRGQTPLIAAEPEPFKVRPADPGGMQVEDQDKLVYDRVGEGAPQPGVENILPPPETPRPPPPVPTPVQESPNQPDPVAEVPPVDVAPAAPQLEPPAPIAAVPAPMPEPDAAPPGEVPDVQDTPDPVPSTQTAAAPEEQSLESMVAALSGDYLIQIAALRSQEDAQNEWNRVSSRFPQLLAQYKPLIVRADLGERGIFYRLRAGPLPGRTDAEQLCTALAEENVGCLVVRNE